MRGFEEKLNWRQERAITALLTSATVPAAAKACGISQATLYRWLQQPAFQERYEATKRQVLEDAIGLLHKASGAAVGVLVNVMRDEKSPASVRVNAATKVLEFGFRGKELLELEQRLKQLEEALEYQQQEETRRYA